MMEAVVSVLCALTGWAVGVPLAVACLRGGRRSLACWTVGLIGIVLCSSSWFVSRALLDWVVAKQGFVLTP